MINDRAYALHCIVCTIHCCTAIQPPLLVFIRSRSCRRPISLRPATSISIEIHGIGNIKYERLRRKMWWCPPLLLLSWTLGLFFMWDIPQVGGNLRIKIEVFSVTFNTSIPESSNYQYLRVSHCWGALRHQGDGLAEVSFNIETANPIPEKYSFFGFWYGLVRKVHNKTNQPNPLAAALASP